MQSAIARRMAAGAVEAQPALVELSRHTERYFEDNLAWEIRDESLPVVNLWITYKASGDNPREYAVGAVMALEVAARESNGEEVEYLKLRTFIGPIAVQRLRA